MARSLAPAELPPAQPWADFRERLRVGTDRRNTGRWVQGEHVTLIGPTGGGKTTLALDLMELRGHSVIFATKAKDRTLNGLRRQGWQMRRTWPPRHGENRVLLWPRLSTLADVAHQGATFQGALHDMFAAGGAWAVCLDDLPYLCDELRLRSLLTTLYQQARAVDMSLVGACQRPRHVPLAALNQATHLFVFRTADDDDVKRLSDLGVFSKDLLRSTIPHLPKYHALYLHTRTGEVQHVAAPPPRGAS